jgi:hypothetical protein
MGGGGEHDAGPYSFESVGSVKIHHLVIEKPVYFM